MNTEIIKALGNASQWITKLPANLLPESMPGQTIKEKGKRHYRLGEFAIVGEATTLAMRSNIKK